MKTELITKGKREFCVYRHISKGLAAVKYGFCWPGLFFNVVWMFARGLWMHGIGWLYWLGLSFYLWSIFAGPLQETLLIHGVFALILLILIILPGVYGNSWLRYRLKSKGFELIDTVRTGDKKSAIEMVSAKKRFGHESFVAQDQDDFVGFERTRKADNEELAPKSKFKSRVLPIAAMFMGAVLIWVNYNPMEEISDESETEISDEIKVQDQTSYETASLEAVDDFQHSDQTAAQAFASLESEAESVKELRHIHDRAEDQKPLPIEGHLNETDLCISHHSSGDWGSAIDACSSAAAQNPENLQVNEKLGKAHLEMGQFVQAASVFRDVVNLSPDNVQAWHNLGKAYMNQGQPQQGIKAFESATQIAPDNGQVWYDLGKAYMQADMRSARQDFRPVSVDFYHHHLGVWHSFMVYHPDQVIRKEAVQALSKALVHSPDYADAWYELGRFFLIAGQWTEPCVYYLEKAVEVNPMSHESWTALGQAYMAAGDLDQAIESFLKARDLNDAESSILISLMDAYSLAGLDADGLNQELEMMKMRID